MKTPYDSYITFIIDLIRVNDVVIVPAFGSSMYPYICSGDLVILKKYKNETIHVGDIIFVYNKNCLSSYIHRVVKIEKNVIITKGDNSRYEDFPVKKRHVVGIFIGKR
ncbi:MAG: signal peptidase I [Spirochaetes bacterium]|nr:signal peptidase I [Spirochaetota bacterium]